MYIQIDKDIDKEYNFIEHLPQDGHAQSAHFMLYTKSH
jgi:hypothetical protein